MTWSRNYGPRRPRFHSYLNVFTNLNRIRSRLSTARLLYRHPMSAPGLTPSMSLTTLFYRNTDILTIICAILVDKQMRFLDLLEALKTRCNVDFWTYMWRVYQQRVADRTISIRFYMSKVYQGHIKPQHYEQVFRLSFQYQCEMCHTSTDPVIIDDMLKKRICIACRQEYYVSNHVLFHTYGLSAHSVVHEVGRFVRYIPLKTRSDSFLFTTFTTNPIDAVAGVSNTMFFWKPDMQLCYDLQAARTKHLQRVSAARLLTACVARRYAQSGKRALFNLRANEMNRTLKPYKCRKWYAGAPGISFKTPKRPCSIMTQRYNMPFVAPCEVHTKLLAERYSGSAADFRQHLGLGAVDDWPLCFLCV